MAGGTKRYEPDLAEFGEMQRTYLWRAMFYGTPALVTLLFTVIMLLVGLLTAAPWWAYFLLALPAFFGAIFQLILIWMERPAMTVDAVAVEIGEGVLRFVNDEAGTVEELRWREGKALEVRRRNDSVEILFPSGRRSRVHWFAYSEREQLLKDLMAIKEGKPEEAAPPKPAEPKVAESPEAQEAARQSKPGKTSARKKKADEEE
jgi:hypothetical protein